MRRVVLLLSGILLIGAAPMPARAAPKPVTLAVIGAADDGNRLQAAVEGARLAAKRFAANAFFEDGIEVVAFDDGGTTQSLKKTLRELKSASPAGVVAVPGGHMHAAYWKAARSVRVPWFVVSAMAPDATRNPGNVLLLGPTPVSQAVAAADSMIAPVAARRVAVVQEPTELGTTLAAAFARNLSSRISLDGVRVWEAHDDAKDVIAHLEGFEADWLYVAMTGVHAQRFARGLAETGWHPNALFCDAARNESMLALAPEQFEGCVFLDGPDPELQGRMGEDLIADLERAGRPIDVASVRSFEGARRVLAAVAAAGSTKFRKVWEKLVPQERKPIPGVLPLHFEPHGGIRLFPFAYWRVRKGEFELWPQGLLPTVGCGPPLGFGRPPPAAINPKGKMGYLTYGDGEKRTIEADLLALGLSTNGKLPELDAFVRDEVLARAIRIANRLFRREPDGSPIPGWSWGLGLTFANPEQLSRGKVWMALVAGDDEAAGGRAFGGWVQVYSTFLKRTMYERRKLEPPISAEDKHLLDGSYRWGEDRANNRRADEIRCLIDGFASAVGLTLSHEYGHLCGCGHDTEHPTSIMNVVAGAGASWEDAVWIPSHQRNVTTALGIEGVNK